MKNEKLQDLSRQYWDALDRQDYEWADFIDSCLEREGVARLPLEELCAVEWLDCKIADLQQATAREMVSLGYGK